MNRLFSMQPHMYSYLVPVSGIDGHETGKRMKYSAQTFKDMDVQMVQGRNYVYLLAVPKPSVFDSAASRMYKEMNPKVYRLERTLAGGRRSKSRKGRSRRSHRKA
jgi:hypothetical protein